MPPGPPHHVTILHIHGIHSDTHIDKKESNLSTVKWARWDKTHMYYMYWTWLSCTAASDIICTAYCSSFSNLRRYLVVCSGSAADTSFGQPPSLWLIPWFMNSIKDVFTCITVHIITSCSSNGNHAEMQFLHNGVFTRGDRRGDRSRDWSPRRSPRVNTV